jgi:FkbM family methyltransferase
MLSSLVRVLLRRCGNQLTRMCPNPIFDTWKLKRRIVSEGGTIVITRSGSGAPSVVAGTTSSGVTMAFRETSTDALILYEILWRLQYRGVVSILELLGTVPTTVLDGGANIGAFMIYMKNLFPQVAIVCVEPEVGNFELLKMNVEANSYTNVVLINGAVWRADEAVQICEGFRGGRERELSFSIRQSTDVSAEFPLRVPGFSLDSLRRKIPSLRYDVVKLDIEGAEAEVLGTLEQIEATMKICRLLVLEIHDEVFDRMAFAENLRRLQLTSMSDGELTFVWSSH